MTTQMVAQCPSIRPPQAKPVLPADDPTQGQCVITGASGEIVTLSPAQCGFAYRDSAFKSREPGRHLTSRTSQ